MTLTGPFATLGRQHSIFNFRELNLKFPVAGVIDSVRSGVFDIKIGVMQPGPHFSRKKKGTGHSHGTDGIQLVGVK